MQIRLTVSFSQLHETLFELFEESNSNMEHLNNISALENCSSNVPGLMALSHNSFGDHQRPQIALSFTEPNLPFYDPVLAHFLPTSECPNSHERNSMNAISQAQSLMNPSPPVCSTGLVGENTTERNNSCGGKKRKRNSEREVEKPREVVHVRARRGQATDSHSLAERLRREKINDKLRCLQDLVPGCYKTMGMAVMLDVIIKYVQSLQNQIEFLSMKLSAASLFYDFNSSEMEALETIQGTNGYETQMMERIMAEGYGGFPQFQSAWPL